MGVSSIVVPWVEPLSLAAVQTGKFALLYSSTRTDYSGRYSYLACNITDEIKSSDFDRFEPNLSTQENAFTNAWFGYLGYGLKSAIEDIPTDEKGYISLPELHMMKPRHIYQFDHQEKQLNFWSADGSAPNNNHESNNLSPCLPPAIKKFFSNMTRDEYLHKAAQTIENINQGNLYQANLTRKFMGELEHAPDSLELFARLCNISPAPYSAFLQLGDTQILSSSPELFLSIDVNGTMHARPIKGTAPRHTDTHDDNISKENLARSEKNRAENLMIVDLMRNDFSHSAELGSIKVSSLFDITTHATIHHMSSTIKGQKKESASTLQAIKCCFPPGSMTGAPKIAAMRLCSDLERQERGVYSGAIGWFGGDGSCELSVVIRTLIIQNNRFEFQIGGGIVADSTPEGELQEIYEKARGIMECLNISRKEMEML